MAGENGGGAFVVIYLVCIFFLIGIPIMVSEIIIGRSARKSPINAMAAAASKSAVSMKWQLVGWMGVVAGFMILSFYAVIAGWVLSYVVQLGSGVFTNSSSELAEGIFSNFVGNVWEVLAWFTIFLVSTILITARGVSSGLEVAVKYLMPILFCLLIALVIYSATTSGHFMEGVDFLFSQF